MTAASAPLQQTPPPSAEQRLAAQRAGEQRAHEPSMEEILASIRRIIADDSALPLSRKPAPSLFREPIPAVASPAEAAPAAPVEAQPPAAVAAEHAAAAVEEEDDDILDLAHPVAVQHVEAERVEPAHVQHEPVHLEEEPMPEVVQLYEPAPPAPAQHAPDQHAPTQHAPLQPAAARPAASQHAPAQLEAEHRDMAPPFAPPPPAVHESHDEALLSPGANASIAASFQSLAATMFLNNTEMVERLTREMLRPMLKTWLDDNLPVLVERLVRAEIERVARGAR